MLEHPAQLVWTGTLAPVCLHTAPFPFPFTWWDTGLLSESSSEYQSRLKKKGRFTQNMESKKATIQGTDF